MKGFCITIITLSKDNSVEFINTSKSIFKQVFNGDIEWLILDKSNDQNRLKNIYELEKLHQYSDLKLKFKFLDMNKKNINGIYPTMNYGLKISTGYSIIFMNSGDKFFDNYSLGLLYENLIALEEKDAFIFGQAKIVSQNGTSWNFPGNKLTNSKNWLRFFEPNHQAILITRNLAKKKYFNEKNIIFADGEWKRNIIKNAKTFTYLPIPVCKFYLGGASSRRPNLDMIRLQFGLKEVSLFRKIITIFKYLIPPFLYKFFPIFQKFKSLFFDYIF